MRGCFEVLLLIIFHFVFFFFVCVFYCGRQPLAHSSNAYDFSNPPFWGSHRPPNTAPFRRKRPTARPRRRPWLGSRPSPAAASIGPRARGPPSSRAPRGPASVGGIRVKPFLGFNASGIRARLTASRIPRHFVVKGQSLVRGGARGWGVGRAQPQRPLSLERKVHRLHAPLAVQRASEGSE